MIWCNDQDLYLATLAYARELLRRMPQMSDQTLGRNVKDRVFAWAFGGGWGHDGLWVGRADTFDYFVRREDYGDVSELAVAEEVRDCLGIES
jgi:hypothetical protein